MFKSLWCMFLFLFVVLLSNGSAATVRKFNEPDGFAGLKWMSPIAEAEKLFQVRRVDKNSERESIVVCLIRVGEMTLDAKLTHLDGRFVGVTFFVDQYYRQELIDAFKQRYGLPTSELAGRMFWDGSTVLIMLDPTVQGVGAGLRVIGGSLEHKTLTNHRERVRKENTNRTAKDL